METKKDDGVVIAGGVNSSVITMPTIGRIVIYRPNLTQRVQLGHKSNEEDVTSEFKLPAIIVAVHSSECVNLKVFTNSEHPDFLVTSSLRGDNDRCWDWPPRN